MLISRFAFVGLFAAVTLLAVPLAQAQLNPFRGSGFELNQRDIEEIGAAAQELFRDNPDAAVGDSVNWENTADGNSGTISIMDSFSYQDLPCFELLYTFKLKKLADERRLFDKRCRTADGQWKAL